MTYKEMDDGDEKGEGQKVQISLTLNLRARQYAVIERVFAFLNQAEIDLSQKDEIYCLVKERGSYSRNPCPA